MNEILRSNIHWQGNWLLNITIEYILVRIFFCHPLPTDQEMSHFRLVQQNNVWTAILGKRQAVNQNGWTACLFYDCLCRRNDCLFKSVFIYVKWISENTRFYFRSIMSPTGMKLPTFISQNVMWNNTDIRFKFIPCLLLTSAQFQSS